MRGILYYCLNYTNVGFIMPKLTDKQERFCREYIIDLNATRASKSAGYATKNANRIGSENLSKLDIQERIAQLKRHNINRVKNECDLDLSADRVLLEVARMAFADIGNHIVVNDDGKIELQLGDLDNPNIGALPSFKMKTQTIVTKNHEGNECVTDQTITYVRYQDKARALELLMKHFGLLKPKSDNKEVMDIVVELQKGRDRVAKHQSNRLFMDITN